MTNILLAGVGGQGTVLASRLIAQAYMDRGAFARTAETIGMAQRGGCVVSHVRAGDEAHSPLIPMGTADLVMGFEPGEAVRCLPYLKRGGAVVAARRAIQPVTASMAGAFYDAGPMLHYLQNNVEDLVLLDGEALCAVCGSPKALNVGLLGAAIGAGLLDVTMEQMQRTLRARVKAKFLDLNLRALELGALMAERM